ALPAALTPALGEPPYCSSHFHTDGSREPTNPSFPPPPLHGWSKHQPSFAWEGPTCKLDAMGLEMQTLGSDPTPAQGRSNTSSLFSHQVLAPAASPARVPPQPPKRASAPVSLTLHQAAGLADESCPIASQAQPVGVSLLSPPPEASLEWGQAPTACVCIPSLPLPFPTDLALRFCCSAPPAQLFEARAKAWLDKA
ncbi:hypothetical protein DV515_00001904, partial [Chloebia gouldiae]